MHATLRHAGILVKSIEKAKETYLALGFQEVSREKLEVLKMTDQKGNIIELVEGRWHPHIAVNWYEDPDENYIEVVSEK